MTGNASDICADDASLGVELAERGYIHIPPARMKHLLGQDVLAGWPGFAQSWDALERDGFMKDGGAYRRRRHAVFRGDGPAIRRQPDRPHYQETAFNALNGGVERWFAPVSSEVVSNPLTRRTLSMFSTLFDRCRPGGEPSPWEIEMHQFRIEASGRESGLPTPEGMHRDGVDWVVMMFVARRNAAGATTSIVDEAGRLVAQVQMTQPLEAIALDDRRFRHGVSPLTVQDAAETGIRDVLVLTYASA